MRWLEAIQAEAQTAESRYGPFTSTHEALGVLIEEVDELREAVRHNALGSIEMEALQVAAVCLRLARQCRQPLSAFAERSSK